ncbi:MFS transporter [Streptomyces sp. URMC 123]|uniref:MFS transporter n=1 Tax=Streptomyces sp. URMC 123 TaxID=3423403 RepID=UPI003F1CF975
MLSLYRDLFTLPGTKPLAVAGLIGRAPRAMIGIGIVGMLSQRTGDYALAGAVAAAFSISLAALGPLIARCVDRRGQRAAARPALAVALLGLAGLALCGATGAPAWVHLPCAAVAGALPNVGSLMRARWSALCRDDRTLHTAFSLESVADELTFVLGPILALTLATAVLPEAGVLCAMVFALVGTVGVTAQRRTEPAPRPAPPARARGAGHPGLWTLVPTFLALGGVFGSLDVVVVAFATERGQRGAASLALACLALSSCVAGLVLGALRPARALPPRLLRCVSALALATVPLLLAQNLPEVAGSLLVAGIFVSPAIVTANSLVERLVPAARLNEGLTWLMSGISGGMSLGALVGGWAVAGAGAHLAFAVPVALAGCAVLVVLCGIRRLGPVV